MVTLCTEKMRHNHNKWAFNIIIELGIAIGSGTESGRAESMTIVV